MPESSPLALQPRASGVEQSDAAALQALNADQAAKLRAMQTRIDELDSKLSELILKEQQIMQLEMQLSSFNMVERKLQGQIRDLKRKADKADKAEKQVKTLEALKRQYEQELNELRNPQGDQPEDD